MRTWLRLLPTSSGGRLPRYRPTPGVHIVLLSPGGPVEDPDEAEALGLTVDAKRLRR